MRKRRDNVYLSECIIQSSERDDEREEEIHNKRKFRGYLLAHIANVARAISMPLVLPAYCVQLSQGHTVSLAFMQVSQPQVLPVEGEEQISDFCQQHHSGAEDKRCSGNQTPLCNIASQGN